MVRSWLIFASHLIVILLFFCHTKGANIVLAPLFGSSHYILFRTIGEELGSRGHQVTLLLSSTQSYKPSDAFTTEVYQVPYEPDFIEKFLARSMEKDKNNTSDQASGFDILNNLAESHANFCRSLVKWEGIKGLKPDVIVGIHISVAAEF
ncbi:uncharacterized protein [Porites lutea]|uniref:uncharacterized protein n=1 Tax=Porites lutea TaxID=51062 RepID=UPI003CC5F9FD